MTVRTLALATAVLALGFSPGVMAAETNPFAGYDASGFLPYVNAPAEAEDISSENLLQRIFDKLKVP